MAGPLVVLTVWGRQRPECWVSVAAGGRVEDLWACRPREGNSVGPARAHCISSMEEGLKGQERGWHRKKRARF